MNLSPRVSAWATYSAEDSPAVVPYSHTTASKGSKRSQRHSTNTGILWNLRLKLTQQTAEQVCEFTPTLPTSQLSTLTWRRGILTMRSESSCSSGNRASNSTSCTAVKPRSKPRYQPCGFCVMPSGSFEAVNRLKFWTNLTSHAARLRRTWS